mgnify:CR=1 FL=1
MFTLTHILLGLAAILCAIVYLLIRILNSATIRDTELTNKLAIDKESITNTISELQSIINKNDDSLIELKTREATTTDQINTIGQNIIGKQDSSQEYISSILSEVNKSIGSVESLKDNVQGLNEILQNKQARGAFSEVMLENLIKSSMASSQYSFQQQLSNNSRVDCALSLDHEGGKLMCIDSKFPLDAYNRYTKKEATLADIKRDFKKHINDISSKYIIHGETSEWALMYIPSEIIFSFVHNEMQDLVAFSFEKKIAIVSPNSMMATIVTVNAAIRDYTFNKETVKIRGIFMDVLKEFDRWNDRFDKIKSSYKRIGDEMENVSISSKKINSKLDKVRIAKLEEDE